MNKNKRQNECLASFWSGIFLGGMLVIMTAICIEAYKERARYDEGDIILVKTGDYKGCFGQIKQYWDFYTPHHIEVRLFSCQNTLPKERIEFSINEVMKIASCE